MLDLVDHDLKKNYIKYGQRTKEKNVKTQSMQMMNLKIAKPA